MAFLEFTAVIDPPKKPKKAAKPGKVVAKEVEPVESEKPKADSKKLESPVKSKTGAEKSTKAAAEKASEAKTEKPDSDKKGGFLGSLRRFLKGDE